MLDLKAWLSAIALVGACLCGCASSADTKKDMDLLQESLGIMKGWSASAQGLLDELKEIESKNSNLKEEHLDRWNWLLKQALKGKDIVEETQRSGATWSAAFARAHAARMISLFQDVEAKRLEEDWQKENGRSGNLWGVVATRATILKPRIDFVTQHPDLEEETALLLVRGSVKIGMSEENARISWGSPNDINKTITAGNVRDQWIYSGGSYLYFDNGKLTLIQN